jgi:hypothetical protein
MGAVVYLVGAFLLPAPSEDWTMNVIRLVIMVGLGGLSYLLLLRILVPETLDELLRLVIKRKAPEPNGLETN